MEREKALETIIVLALASLVISQWAHINWFIYVAVGFLALGIISKGLTMAMAKVWFGLSHYLGTMMNYVLMFIIFYLILVPLALLQRLFGKNQLRRKTEGSTFFHFRNHQFESKDIDKPW